MKLPKISNFKKMNRELLGTIYGGKSVESIDEADGIGTYKNIADMTNTTSHSATFPTGNCDGHSTDSNIDGFHQIKDMTN